VSETHPHTDTATHNRQHQPAEAGDLTGLQEGGGQDQEYLNRISGRIAGSLAAHELKAVPKPTEQPRQESPVPAIPVAQVGSNGRRRHTSHWPVQEPDVEADPEREAREREVEEGGVDQQVRHTVPQDVALVVGRQVDRRQESAEAGSGEEDQAQANQLVGF